MKVCYICKEDKLSDQFYRHKGNDDGLLGKCKDCCKIQQKKNYESYDEDKAVKYRWRGYRGRCIHKNREFDLTYEEFESMLLSPCHYCGGMDKFKNARINGIDRVDNEAGYVPGNCVPCCVRCNSAKGTGKLEDFLAWIERIKS